MRACGGADAVCVKEHEASHVVGLRSGKFVEVYFHVPFGVRAECCNASNLILLFSGPANHFSHTSADRRSERVVAIAFTP